MSSKSKRRPTAVVTGASLGIGAAIADKLLSQGWNVCLLARSVDKMNEIASNYDSKQSLVLHCDLNDTQSVINGCKHIIKWCTQETGGYLNLLINNAGFGVNPSEMEVPEGPSNDEAMLKSIEIWDDHINVMLRSPMIFTKYLIDLLKNSAMNPVRTDHGLYDGSIINVSSTLSGILFMPALLPYSVAKAGLNQLTKLNAFELSGKFGIRCNALITGAIKTTLWESSGFTDEQYDNLISLIPIGRIGTTHDMNEMFLFLANKDKSGYLTGSLLEINGGCPLVGIGGNPYQQFKQSQSKL